MYFKEEENLDAFPFRQGKDYHVARVKIDLPPPFCGEDDKQSFLCWACQFEVAVRALAERGNERDYQYELVRILPTRLSKAAFLLWDNLPATVQSDYSAVKERLKEAFGRKQFLNRFRTDLSARPRAPHESLVVYAAEISRLVSEAFPDYGENATREEKFRRFLGGLDSELKLKCHEQGATDMEEALVIAERCENAREAVKQDFASKVTAAGSAVGHIASVHSVTDYGGLHRAVHSLTEELREMRVDMKRMAEENQRLRTRTSPGGWRGSSSPGRMSCRCTCGGYGCQSQVSHEPQYSRSPDRRFPSPGRDRGQFTPSRSRSPGATWSPRGRSPSPGRRMQYEDDAHRRRGVRFISPHSDHQSSHQGNGV